jgi:GTP-binding protein Era
MNDYFIASECTRGSLLDFLHQEIPYNIIVNNNLIKYINKNNIKIKQTIEITNKRYKPIILGKKGESIKRIREKSQIELESVFNCKVHLYLQVVVNDKKIK